MPRKYKKYETEDLVWAKKQGFPWPGKVSKSPLGELRNGQYYIFFLGSFNRAWVKAEDIYPYINYVDKFSKGSNKKLFKLGVSLMAMLYAELYPKKETVSFDHEMSSAEDDDDEREQGAMEVDTVMRSKDEKVEEPQRRISQRLRVKLLTQEDNRKEKKGGRKNKKEKCCASPFQYPPVNIWNKEEIRKIITKKLVISLRRYHD